MRTTSGQGGEHADEAGAGGAGASGAPSDASQIIGFDGVTPNSLGALETWLNRSVQFVGVWDDVPEALKNQYALDDWKDWSRGLYNQVGGVYKSVESVWDIEPESWASAANGSDPALEKLWNGGLAKMGAWGNRSNLYVGFADAFNVSGQYWNVQVGEEAAFKQAFARFHEKLASQVPGASLVWCPKAWVDTDLEVLAAYPGDSAVDVIGVSLGNDPDEASGIGPSDSEAEFARKMALRTQSGDPRGVEAWRQFAETQHKPFAVCEWGTVGDDANFVRLFGNWLVEHAGTGAGQVRFAIYHNQWAHQLFPPDQQPTAAAAFQGIFGR